MILISNMSDCLKAIKENEALKNKQDKEVILNIIAVLGLILMVVLIFLL